ncbi:MATE efflux family protein [Paenibacillus vortex V453]|uniref:Probable multidrug resistance protein NorM n=3 Tax=Paenibacillus TaxID=44249 RepID=A0A163LL50_9BACL|nr:MULTISPECIES: MATE family efflux transporter [Paenibacillus]ANA82137.1 MATE family efflux transporter [Paenibacillus glucanolyticus]AVV59125.1 MATE family efflux transporter [Paenibacillus glucanolyticus]EFU41497.1 MATE efflux family protein [Paenibacillus vortex V453]ETT43582.1 MATE efflux family protein [Paenibacillus sp. FSL R5-808]KZS48220.1 MATE family efflux transporter [Paenibacillus glucanolyticus]
MLVRLRTQMNGLLQRNLSGESMDYRQILALFFPILIDQAFIIGLNLVNTAMISSSGVAAVSAVNMVDSLNIFLINVFVAVATGGTVVVAQYKGSGNALMVSRASAATVTSVAMIALGIALLIIGLHQPVLNLLFGSASPEVLESARIYLIGSSTSFIGIAVVQAVCGALRGIGKTRASLALSLIMNLLYVLLNIVFITLLNMGVMGMTLAVNIARFAGAACALYYLFRVDATLHIRLRDLFHFPISMLRKIMFIGLPFAAEQMFFNGGKLLTQVFIVSLGTYAIATNAIGSSLAAVFQIPASALSLTIVTVVGQCIGRGNIADARKFIRSFLWLGAFSLALMGLILMPLYRPLVGLFNPPPEIVNDLFVVLLINTLVQVPLWSVSFILPSALRAAGDSKFTSITSMLTMWLFRVILGYIMGIVLGYGILGVWLAMNCEWGVRGAIFLWRFRGKKWYAHKLI